MSSDADQMSTAQLRSMLAVLPSLAETSDDFDRVDRLRLLEELKSAAAAVQMQLAVELDRSHRVEQASAGEPAERQGKGVAGQIALARRLSPWAAARWLGQAKILTAELPGTFTELAAGRTTEWRALLVGRETAMLSRADRLQVDRELAPRLEKLGDRATERAARTAALRLDPAAAVERARRAERERCVSIRPAPDAMTYLTALLPVAQGVACYAALSRAADTHVGVGDEPRGRGQVMADTLVQRLTGQAEADAVPVEIAVVMTDTALIASPGTPGRDEPALIPGHGPVPAALARELALGGSGTTGEGPRWIRRLYRVPSNGQLVAMDSRRRTFTDAQRRFVALRDQTCRTPWCDAPVRHADHVIAHADGGPTSVTNAQGLCEACNHTKSAPGWSARSARDGTVHTRTPTGHRYQSPPVRAPGADEAATSSGPEVVVDLRWFRTA